MAQDDPAPAAAGVELLVRAAEDVRQDGEGRAYPHIDPVGDAGAAQVVQGYAAWRGSCSIVITRPAGPAPQARQIVLYAPSVPNLQDPGRARATDQELEQLALVGRDALGGHDVGVAGVDVAPGQVDLKPRRQHIVGRVVRAGH